MCELHVRDGVSEFRRTESAEKVVELREYVAIVRLAEQPDELSEPDPGGWKRAGEDVAGNVLTRRGGGRTALRFARLRDRRPALQRIPG